MNYFVFDKENPEHYKMLETLMFEYVSETDLHRGNSQGFANSWEFVMSVFYLSSFVVHMVSFRIN